MGLAFSQAIITKKIIDERDEYVCSVCNTDYKYNLTNKQYLLLKNHKKCENCIEYNSLDRL